MSSFNPGQPGAVCCADDRTWLTLRIDGGPRLYTHQSLFVYIGHDVCVLMKLKSQFMYDSESTTLTSWDGQHDR